MVNPFHSFSLSALRGVRRLGAAQRKSLRALTKNLLVTPAAPKASSKIPSKASVERVARKTKSVTGRWRRFTFIATPTDRIDCLTASQPMAYWLYEPSGMTAGVTPLVVMLHGCKQTALEFAHGTRMNRLAESKGFGVLYPQQSLSTQSHRCWPWYHKDVQSGEGEAQVIAAIMRRVVGQYHFDPERTYVAGLSAGAAMAHIIALRYPQLVAAVGLHSGPIFGAASTSVGAFGVMQRGSLKSADVAIDKVIAARTAPFPPMPALLIQGSLDSVVRPVNLHQLTLQFCRLNRLNATQRQATQFYPAGRSTQAAHAYTTVDYRVGRKTLLRVCEVAQLEHAWSGGDAAYRFNARKGPDASRLLWQFFAPHQRACRDSITSAVTEQGGMSQIVMQRPTAAR